MTQHASIPSLSAYAAADPALDEVGVWAVEAHLQACAECRVRLAGLTRTIRPDLHDLLAGTGQVVLEAARSGPHPSAPQGRWRRVARRSGWSDWSMPTWALLSATAMLLAHLLDDLYPLRPSLVLLLAPVTPLAGLALAWSHHADPGWEISTSSARAGLELVLRRSLAVLASVLVPLTAAGLLRGESPALWLLPCLTFTAATLWLGSRIGMAQAATVFSVGWLAVVVVPAVVTVRTPVLIRPEGLTGWAVAAVICTVLAAVRLGSFRRLPTWH
jgi:hypothetical protein